MIVEHAQRGPWRPVWIALAAIALLMAACGSAPPPEEPAGQEPVTESSAVSPPEAAPETTPQPEAAAPPAAAPEAAPKKAEAKPPAPPPAPKEPRVVIKTNKGSMTLELYPDAAPDAVRTSCNTWTTASMTTPSSTA